MIREPAVGIDDLTVVEVADCPFSNADQNGPSRGMCALSRPISTWRTADGSGRKPRRSGDSLIRERLHDVCLCHEPPSIVRGKSKFDP